MAVNVMIYSPAILIEIDGLYWICGVLLCIVEVGVRHIVVHLMVQPIQLVQTPYLNIVANNPFF
jgi:C4-dicarboxylate transporter